MISITLNLDLRAMAEQVKECREKKVSFREKLERDIRFAGVVQVVGIPGNALEIVVPQETLLVMAELEKMTDEDLDSLLVNLKKDPVYRRPWEEDLGETGNNGI